MRFKRSFIFKDRRNAQWLRLNSVGSTRERFQLIRIFAHVLIVCWVLLNPFPSLAFFRNRIESSGQKLFWLKADLPLRWAQNTSLLPSGMDEDEFIKALSQAYGQWSSHPHTFLSFTESKSEDSLFTLLWVASKKIDPALGLNSHHVINEEWVKAGLPSWSTMGFGSRSIGITISYLRGPNGGHANSKDPLSGELLDADILYNNQNYTFCSSHHQTCGPGEIDLVSVAAHEIGHQIGLDHSTTNENSLMYPSIASGEVKRVSSDEVAFIQCVYPIDSHSPEARTACLLEEGGGGIPGGSTYVYGNNASDASGACASIVHMNKPPKNPGASHAFQSFFLFVLILVMGRILHSFPLNRGWRFGRNIKNNT